MMSIAEMAKNALVNYGAMLPDWKVEILGTEAKPYSDWVEVTCQITKKRCRKPFIKWNLAMNMARSITDFEKSDFRYL